MLKLTENIVKTFNKIMENYPEFKFDSTETNDNSNITMEIVTLTPQNILNTNITNKYL